LQTICPGWLQTAIFLISASWVARIIGVSQPAPISSISEVDNVSEIILLHFLKTECSFRYSLKYLDKIYAWVIIIGYNLLAFNFRGRFKSFLNFWTDLTPLFLVCHIFLQILFLPLQFT
jgi:hypothetical protein